MSRTTRRHLPPDQRSRTRRSRNIRELSKPTKQTRAATKAALRKEHR